MIEQLNAIMEKFRTEFRDINSGGCGVAAVIIAEGLESAGIPVSIRICDMYGDYCSVDEIREQVDENTTEAWNDTGMSFTHVWCEFLYEDILYAIDTDAGAVPAGEMYSMWDAPMDGEVTLEEMTELANDDYGWNSWFDRSQIEPMRDMGRMEFGRFAADNSRRVA